MLEQEEADQLLDNERLTKDAVSHAENNGIVFIDEIDKICGAHAWRAASAAATCRARACSATCCR